MRRRPSFAIVVSMLALVVALGGTAYALSANSIKSRHIAKGAVKGSDVRSDAVKSKHVRAAAIGGSEVADGAISGADVADGAISGRHVVQSSLDELETSATVTELPGQPPLDSTFEDIITAQITVDEPKTVLAMATIEAEGTGGVPERVGCRMEIAGVDSGDAFAHTIPATATADEATITVSFARPVAAGTHPVALVCRQIDGSAVFVEDGWLSAWAAG